VDKFQIYELNDSEIVDAIGDPERLLPDLFKDGGGMKRFVTDPLLGFRAGHTKLSKGQGFDTYFWYDEFWVMRHGRGEAVATDRTTGEQSTYQLGPKDTVYIARGCHVTGRGISDEPWVFFYVAIPASKRDATWLAHMTPQDIEDVRKREEYR
jgi:hypothetical protein